MFWAKREDHRLNLQPDVIRALDKDHQIIGCYEFDGTKRKGALCVATLEDYQLKSLVESPCDEGQYDLLVCDPETVITINSMSVLALWKRFGDELKEMASSERICASDAPDSTVGTKVTASKDRSLFAGSSLSGDCMVADSESLETITRWRAHESECWTLQFLEGELLLTGGEDCNVKVWDHRAGKAQAAIDR